MKKTESAADVVFPRKTKIKPGWYSCIISNIKMKKGRLIIRVKKVKKVV